MFLNSQHIIKLVSRFHILVVHPESPERNDVALGELDVVFTSSLSCPINCALSRRERLSCTLFLLMPISDARLSAFGLYGASVEMTASVFFSKFGKRRIVSVIQAFYLYVIRLLSLRTLR